MKNGTGITSEGLRKSVVLFYQYRGGELMRPTFGVVVKTGGIYFAVSVAHTVEDRERFEVWTGVHPDVAKGFGMRTAGRCLFAGPPDSAQIADDEDLMAVRLDEDRRHAFESVVSDVGLLRPALIACLDFEPDGAQVLNEVLDCQAGLVEREDALHLRLSCLGKGGMSGAPVVIPASGGEFGLVGLYTGTPKATPLTGTATAEHANVVRIGKFLAALRA